MEPFSARAFWVALAQVRTGFLFPRLAPIASAIIAVTGLLMLTP